MRSFARGALGAVLVALTIAIAAGTGLAQEPDDGAGGDEVEIVLFWMNGCPHCENEWEFLDELLAEVDGVSVVDFEVSGSAENRAIFAAVAAEMGFEARGVPTTIVGDQVWVGFGDATAAQIRAAVDAALEGRVSEPDPGPVIDVPGVGTVELDAHDLLLATLLIAFVDGFNPCSLWVLSMLLALVLHSGSRRRVVVVGVVFLTITTTLYGLYMIGIYSVLSYVAYLTWIQRGVAVVALAFAAVSLNDYFRPGSGLSLSIPAERKPALYARMRSLAGPDRSLGGVVAGTAALAVGVSLVETPCTAGFPIIWTNLLTDRDVPTLTAVGLFLVYMAVFLVDELAIFAAAVVTMRVAKLQEEHGRLLKLVAGVVMLALAVTMIVDPDQLSSLGGTIVVFGSSAAAVALVVAVERLRRTPPGDDGRGRDRDDAGVSVR